MAITNIDQTGSNAAARRMMVDCQIRPFDVTNSAVLGAFLDVDRENFVPAPFAAIAYSDRALPAFGAPKRLLIAPMILARMLQAADIGADDHVLDVAGGSFYTAALLSHLARSVVALESSGAAEGRAALASAGAQNVDVVMGPLAAGWAARAPYDVIFVNGGLETRPGALLDQLKDGGRLVCCDLQGKSPKIQRFERSGTTIGSRAICDAAAPALAEFRRAAAFVF